MNRTEKDLQDALKSLTGCMLDKQPGYGEENEIIISPEDKNKLPIGTKEGVLKSIDPNKEDGYTHQIYFPESNTSVWAKLTNDMGMNWAPTGTVDENGIFYPDVKVIVTISLMKDTLQWKVVGVQEKTKITPGATTIDRGGSKITVHEDEITQEAGVPSPDKLAEGDSSPVKFTISPTTIKADVYDNYHFLDISRFEVMIPRYNSFMTIGEEIVLDKNGSRVTLKDPYVNVHKGDSNTWWNPNTILSTVGNTNFTLSPCLVQSQTGPATEILTCEYIQHEILDQLICQNTIKDELTITKDTSKATFDSDRIRIERTTGAFISIDEKPPVEGEEDDCGNPPRKDNILLDYGGVIRINPDEIWLNQVNNFRIDLNEVKSTVFAFESNEEVGDTQHKLMNAKLNSTIYAPEDIDPCNPPDDDDREKLVDMRLERDDVRSRATITVNEPLQEIEEEEKEYPDGFVEFKVDNEWAYINGQRICVEPCGGFGGCTLITSVFEVE
jgi:hypothetical protein